jgi:hypothetical protein
VDIEPRTTHDDEIRQRNHGTRTRRSIATIFGLNPFSFGSTMSVVASNLSRRSLVQLRSAGTKYASFIRPQAVIQSAVTAHPPSVLSNRRGDNSIAWFSSVEKKTGGIRGWMEGRQERQQQKQYMEQMERLSSMEQLTLANYQEELKRGLSGFMAKVKFLQTKEIRVAQEVVDVVGAFMGVLGNDATADDLNTMTRIDRLKVAGASNKTVEEIAIMVSQIQNMDLMQRTLRKRKLEGKIIPVDSSKMQEAIKKDARGVMTKSQKDVMKKRQMAVAKKMARKKR